VQKTRGVWWEILRFLCTSFLRFTSPLSARLEQAIGFYSLCSLRKARRDKRQLQSTARISYYKTQNMSQNMALSEL